MRIVGILSILCVFVITFLIAVYAATKVEALETELSNLHDICSKREDDYLRVLKSNEKILDISSGVIDDSKDLREKTLELIEKNRELNSISQKMLNAFKEQLEIENGLRYACEKLISACNQCNNHNEKEVTDNETA